MFLFHFEYIFHYSLPALIQSHVTAHVYVQNLVGGYHFKYEHAARSLPVSLNKYISYVEIYFIQ